MRESEHGMSSKVFFCGILFNKLHCFSMKVDGGRMKVEIGGMEGMGIVEHQQKVNLSFTALPSFWRTFREFFDSRSRLTSKSRQEPGKV